MPHGKTAARVHYCFSSIFICRMKRALAGVSLLLSLMLFGYLCYVAAQIEKQSSRDEARPADAILVLGAAEYHGKPSPVLQARLNHALFLYVKGYAPYILTTGGAGGDPIYTEGGVGRSYLIRHNVPAPAILADPEGATTPESVEAAVQTLRAHHLHSCIVVSDGYHIYRVKRMLEARGLKVYGSPRPERPLSPAELRWLSFRQAVAYLLSQAGIDI
jgi:uncharacterized SAM-binding protein YcdF (DUF218 family)